MNGIYSLKNVSSIELRELEHDTTRWREVEIQFSLDFTSLCTFSSLKQETKRKPKIRNGVLREPYNCW
jgi:predicted RNA-binding protein with PUA-like domain